MRLTGEQRGAVNERGHVCLGSCPGSGKTRAIVAKLLSCIESVRDTTRRIACITHTVSAADEIEIRLRETCFAGEDIYYEVATIHGFALQNILRPFNRLLTELRHGFTILTPDADEYSQRAKQLIHNYGLKASVLDEFEHVQRSPDGNISPVEALPLLLLQERCNWLDENAYVTLNEIVYHAGRLISGHIHIASALASRFSWILVDEFQDSSPGQIEILKQIYKFGRTTFFCVGDPNQSIYRFAGASPELLTDFAEHIRANISHRLTANFRSSAHICSRAEQLCPSRPPMRAVGQHAKCELVPIHLTVVDAKTGILDYFLPAVAALKLPFGEVAILASRWISLFNLARELRSQNIPIVGPGARPYRRSHLIAQAAEAVGAYLESPTPDIAIAVQRSLFGLVANLTHRAPNSIFDFRGRIAVCKLLAEAASARQNSAYAADWIADLGGRCSRILVDAEILSPKQADSLQESADQMAADILGRNNGAAVTIEELGIFARPKNCIQLLTVHKAKGREFEAVAIIEAHDGQFPHFSINRITDEAEREAQYGESRRVIYVAATRAKRVLMFFSDTAHHRNRPTPFLAEMGL